MRIGPILGGHDLKHAKQRIVEAVKGDERLAILFDIVLKELNRLCVAARLSVEDQRLVPDVLWATTHEDGA